MEDVVIRHTYPVGHVCRIGRLSSACYVKVNSTNPCPEYQEWYMKDNSHEFVMHIMNWQVTLWTLY